MKYFALLAGVAVLLIGGSSVYQNLNSAESATGEIVSQSGMHRHPHLEIYIHGEQYPIPEGIGLAGAHMPVHTHEDDGIIHLEFEGRVQKDDIRLGRFFEIWGKPFNRNQIFGYEDGEGGELSMLVNGEPSTEYENYIMKDKDDIVIRYE